MAFLLERTLTCDEPGCEEEFKLVCRKNSELELAADKQGWYIRSYLIYTNPQHICPKHRKPSQTKSQFA